MKEESEIIELPIDWKAVIEMARGAMENKHLLRFYYESKTGNKGERTIRPYMIIPRGENLELVGLPTTELSKPKEKRQPGHYTISQLKQRLESEKFEILPETFDEPGVPPNIVVNTQTPPICRFIYYDEDEKKVKAKWQRIRYA